MPRTVQITLPGEQTEGLLGELARHEGVLSLRVDRGGGVRPPGDIVTLQVLNRHWADLLKAFERQGIGRADSTSLVTTQLASFCSVEHAAKVTTDSSDSSWEEMEQTLARESHLDISTVLVMFVAGFTAAAGIASGALHVIIGAMVIAPGFEPLVRLVLGAVTRSAAWRRGLVSTAGSYLSLLVGAAAAAGVLKLTGTPLLDGSGAYENNMVLAQYWSTFSVASVSVSILAGAAGAILVIAQRSVLTAGVMIALSLVPAAALVPVAMLAGDFERVGMAALRWIVEVGIVLGTSGAVLLWKRKRDGRSRMLL